MIDDLLFPGYDPEFGQGDHMFNDLALSREILREFHSRISETSSGQKLSVMVLQRSVWPFAVRKIDVDLNPSVCALLPFPSFCAFNSRTSQMKTDLLTYTTFYKAKHQGHKLEWDHSLGTATLRARFNVGNKDLTVSLYQAVVLLLFNDEAEIGYKTILESTRMGEAYIPGRQGENKS